MKVALLGTGLMGAPMSERLLERGTDLTVYNRTASKTDPLKDAGAKVAGAPAEACRQADCILLMLSDAVAIEDCLFDGSMETLEGKAVIQMGTISPEQSRNFQEKVEDLKGEYCECPVLGSRKESKEGTLILLFGGTKQQFEKFEGFLKNFGPQPRYIGETGLAAAFKLALNHLIASHAVSFSLSMGIIEKNRGDPAEFLNVLRESSLMAPMFEKKFRNWKERDYENPNFPAKHLLKDVQLVIDEARHCRLSTEVVESIAEILKKTGEKGLSDKDYSSVFNIINQIQ